MVLYESMRDATEGNDIEHHAIWDMFSKILQEHSGDNVEIELKSILWSVLFPLLLFWLSVSMTKPLTNPVIISTHLEDRRLHPPTRGAVP